MQNETHTYEPIDDEMLWGIPVDEQPQDDPDRCFFNEQQAIFATEHTEGTEEISKS